MISSLLSNPFENFVIVVVFWNPKFCCCRFCGWGCVGWSSDDEGACVLFVYVIMLSSWVMDSSWFWICFISLHVCHHLPALDEEEGFHALVRTLEERENRRRKEGSSKAIQPWEKARYLRVTHLFIFAPSHLLFPHDVCCGVLIGEEGFAICLRIARMNRWKQVSKCYPEEGVRHFCFVCVWRRYISKLGLRISFHWFEKYTRTWECIRQW